MPKTREYESFENITDMGLVTASQYPANKTALLQLFILLLHILARVKQTLIPMRNYNVFMAHICICTFQTSF